MSDMKDETVTAMTIVENCAYDVPEDISIEHHKGVRFWIILMAIVCAISVIRIWFFDIVVIDGASMTPTYHNGQIVGVQKIGLSKIDRYDVVLCKSVDGILIKRVIGLPGDTVKVDDMGIVYVNGEELPADYQWDIGQYASFPNEWIVNENQIFVLGDNRENSKDSRFYGPFDYNVIVGKVISK